MKLPTASVIVATLDEEATIDHILDIALGDSCVVEVIVADGGSHDTTRDRVRARAMSDTRVRLVLNDYGGQSAGLNMAASVASGLLLVRLDAHTTYGSDYVRASVEAWNAGISVGGPMLARGNTKWSRATANAMREPLAIGPARFHHATGRELVDTVYLGTYERAAFIKLGGYRTFPSGTVEDVDFYQRWRADGLAVVVDPSIQSWYQPRETWGSLRRQYFRYGLGKAEMLWLNRRLPSLRPVMPAVLVAAIISLSTLALLDTWIPLAVLCGVWAMVLATVAARAKEPRLRTGLVAATMQAAYGTGLWWGILSGRPTIRTLGLSQPDNRGDDEED